MIWLESGHTKVFQEVEQPIIPPTPYQNVVLDGKEVVQCAVSKNNNFNRELSMMKTSE